MQSWWQPPARADGSERSRGTAPREAANSSSSAVTGASRRSLSAMDGDRSHDPREREQAREHQVPTPEERDDSVRDGPPEVEDAAEQEVEYPADETDEG